MKEVASSHTDVVVYSIAMPNTFERRKQSASCQWVVLLLTQISNKRKEKLESTGLESASVASMWLQQRGQAYRRNFSLRLLDLCINNNKKLVEYF